MQITPELEEYLHKWYKTSTEAKRANGVTIDLSFGDFLSLLTEKRAASLQKAIEGNYLHRQMARDNPYAYVLTWQSYAARSSSVFNLNTATICTRMKSQMLAIPQKGDKLRDSHKANLSKRLTGRQLSTSHKRNISEARKAQPGRQWTPEQKAATSERAKAREAAKRGF